MRILIVFALALALLPSCGDKTSSGSEESSSPSGARKGTPSYDAIVYHFFNTYVVSVPLQRGQNLGFEKHPDGWHVLLREAVPGQPEQVVKSDELIWDRNTGKYAQIKAFEAKKEPADGLGDLSQVYKVINNPYSQKLNYMIHDFYGYDEAGDDAIAAYGGQNDLDDTALYTLASAYMQKVFYYQDGPDKPLDETEWKNAVLGLELKRELAQRSPDFETIVGDIGTKYANDAVSFHYYEGMYYSAPVDHPSFLTDNLYSEGIVELSKNVLAACPENSVLFTFGDNDTYPLIYIQDHMNFRKDVLIVNSSLLFTHQYLDYLKDQKGLKLTMDRAYQKTADKFFLINPASEDVDIRDVFATIESFDHAPEGEQQQVENAQTIPGKVGFVLGSDERVQATINNRYAYIGDLAMLDIISSNVTERPICWAWSGTSRFFFGLDNYVRKCGLIQELRTEWTLGGGMDTVKTKQNLIENASWDHYNSLPKFMAGAVPYAFYELYRVQKDTTDKLETISYILDNFAPKGRSYQIWFGLAVDMVHSKQIELANRLLEDIGEEVNAQWKAIASKPKTNINYQDISQLSGLVDLCKRFESASKSDPWFNTSSFGPTTVRVQEEITNYLEELIVQRPHLGMLASMEASLVEMVKERR